jgi:hypothetical protein
LMATKSKNRLCTTLITPVLMLKLTALSVPDNIVEQGGFSQGSVFLQNTGRGRGFVTTLRCK